jgi:hypothetical protein
MIAAPFSLSQAILIDGSSTQVVLLGPSLNTSIFDFQTGLPSYNQAVVVKRSNMTQPIRVVVNCSLSLAYTLSPPAGSPNLAIGIGLADATSTLFQHFSSLGQSTVQFNGTSPSGAGIAGYVSQTTISVVTEFTHNTQDQYLFPWFSSTGAITGAGVYQLYSFSIEILRL